MAGFAEHGTRVPGILLVAAVTLAGCSTQQPYDKPIFPFSKSFRAAPAAKPVLQTGNRWWLDFQDPTLNTLIERALAGNVDLEIAREKVIEARANVGTVPAPYSLSSSVSSTSQAAPVTGTLTQTQGSLSFSWLLDPYGLRHQQLQVVGAQREVAKAEVDAARQVLMLNMAQAYVNLRYSQKLMELRQQQLRSRRQTAALTRKLYDAGAVTQLDVVRTQALVAETQTQIPPLSAAILGYKSEIAVLAGVAPDKFDINLAANSRQPRPQKAVELGIPADLLRNRPDIQIAELNYYAAVTDIGIARADLYPRLSLSGTISKILFSAVTGPQVLFSPAINFPALPNEGGQAAVAVREARARQALESWKSTVLGALKDVDTAYADYQGSAVAVREASRYVRLQRQARDLTVKLVSRQGATVPDLISAEENVARADVVLAQNLRQQAQDFIQLNISLGAGSQVGRPAKEPILSPEDLIAAMQES